MLSDAHVVVRTEALNCGKLKHWNVHHAVSVWLVHLLITVRVYAQGKGGTCALFSVGEAHVLEHAHEGRKK